MKYDNFLLPLLSKYRSIQRKYPDNKTKQKNRLCLWLFKRLFDKKEAYRPRTSPIIHILFLLDGGIGDIVLAFNFLKQFKKHIQCDNEIDIVVPHHVLLSAKQLSYHQTFIKHVYDYHQVGYRYDMVVSFIRIPVLRYVYYPKISQDAFLQKWVDTIYQFNTDYCEYTLSGSIADAVCETYTQIQGRKRISQGNIESLLHMQDDLVVYVVENHQDVLKRYGLSSHAFITVQRGTGQADGFNTYSTRLWDLDNYHQLCRDLKRLYPDLMIVQIGDKSCETIQNTDMNLCGKTTFSELLVLLKMAHYHIDGECGMVHLRHFLSAKPSVVLFGPTKKDFYAYPENINISSNICIGCEWIHERWRTQCLKTGDKAMCLKTIQPSFVIEKIREYEDVHNKRI